jgi:hypothetical protein
MLAQTSGESAPHQKQGKSSYQLVCKHLLVFEVQPSRSPDLSLLDFYLWGHLKTQVYSASIENEETLYQRSFSACQAIRNRPGIFGRVRQSTIRRVHAGIDSGGGHFEPLL